MPEVLKKINGRYKTCILSNADNDDPLIDILLRNGFHFNFIVTSELVEAYKPQPIIFQKALAGMKCQKDQVILIGDSQLSDVLGAKNFGIKVIWLNRKGESLGADFPEPDYQITNLNQLFDIIEI